MASAKYRKKCVRLKKNILTLFTNIYKMGEVFYTQYIAGNHICQSLLHLILVEVHPYQHTIT